MIKISQTKQLRRDICRTTDHIWVDVSGTYSKDRGWNGRRCSRCKKKEVVAEWHTVVPYSELEIRKFNIIDRAKDRINKPEEQ